MAPPQEQENIGGVALLLVPSSRGSDSLRLLDLVMLCVIVGTVFFVGGLAGEMIGAHRAELRELRCRLDDGPR